MRFNTKRREDTLSVHKYLDLNFLSPTVSTEYPNEGSFVCKFNTTFVLIERQIFCQFYNLFIHFLSCIKMKHHIKLQKEKFFEKKYCLFQYQQNHLAYKHLHTLQLDLRNYIALDRDYIGFVVTGGLLISYWNNHLIKLAKDKKETSETFLWIRVINTFKIGIRHQGRINPQVRLVSLALK